MREESTQGQGVLRHSPSPLGLQVSLVSNAVTWDKKTEVLVIHACECRLTANGYLETDVAWPGQLATELDAQGPYSNAKSPGVLLAMYSDPTGLCWLRITVHAERLGGETEPTQAGAASSAKASKDVWFLWQDKQHGSLAPFLTRPPHQSLVGHLGQLLHWQLSQ